MATAAEAFLDDETAAPSAAEQFLDSPPDVGVGAGVSAVVAPTATAPVTPSPAVAFLDAPPAGEDPNITGGAQMRATPTLVDKLKAGEFGGAMSDTYETLRRQVSGLIGPTEAERIENSVQWGKDAKGNPKFEYKPLGDRMAREAGLMTPFLKVEPMHRADDDSLATAAGKAVFNTASGITGSLLSPGSVVLGGVGEGAPIAGKAIGAAFSVDMAKAFKESADRAIHADNPQDKIEGWLSALSSLGFAYLGGTHAAGVDASLRPGAGGKVAGGAFPRIAAPDIDLTRLQNVAPATAVALKSAPAEAPSPAEAASEPVPVTPPPFPTQPPPLPENVVKPTPRTETGELDMEPASEPTTVSTLHPSDYPVIERPLEGLKLSKEVPNFKSDADPVTGVVEGQQLEGKYERLGTGAIIEWERADGSREVVSGRHRFDLANRTGEKTIPAQVVKESEGWTPQKVARLDAEINIRDGQGTTSDYANYFRNSEGTLEEAKAGGLLARTKGRAGFAIGRNASDDFFALFQAKKVSEPHAVAIVEAAGKDAGLQRVGARYAQSNPRASAVDVSNRVKAASLVDSSSVEAPAQGELWDSGDSTMAAMDKAAQAAKEFQQEKTDDVRTLQAALGKSQELKLTKAEAKKFNVQDPNSVLEIRRALDRVKGEAAAWDNWHLNPEMRDAVLKKSGTADTLKKSEPAPVVEPPAPEPTPEPTTPEADFFSAMGIEPPKPETPRPARRANPADVVETPLDPAVVEVPEGADRVFKAKVGKATGTVVEYPDRLEVKDLVSLQEGQGEGSAVLEALKAKGKPIELTAGQRTTDTPIEKLSEFYRNRGFTEMEGSPGRFRWEPPVKEEAVTYLSQPMPAAGDASKMLTPEEPQASPDVVPQNGSAERNASNEPAKTDVPSVERPLPQAAGASNITELQRSQNLHAADVFNAMSADGVPSKEAFTREFLRHYPELEDDTAALNRVYTVAAEAAARFKAAEGRKPMPAIIGEIMGEIRKSGTTGIKNAMADAIRRQLGLREAFAPARRAFIEVWDEAMRHIENNPQAQDELIQALRDNPRATVTDMETAMLAQRQIDLETQHAFAADKVKKAFEAGDDNARTIAMADQMRSEAVLLELLDINKRVGSEQGRSLAARKMLGNRDYSLEKMIVEARGAKGGEDLTPAEREKVTKQSEEIAKTQAEFEAREDAADKENAEKAADDTIADLKKEATETPDPETEPLVASIAERIYQRLKKASDEAKARLRGRLGELYANPFQLGIIRDLAIIAAEAIGRGVRAFSKWREEAISEYGDKVDPYLQEAWNEADKLVERSVQQAAPRGKANKVNKAVRKLDPEQIRDRATGGMQKAVAEEDFKLRDLAPYLRKIALSLVRDGLTEREPLLDAVHEYAKEAMPDIERRQTMDLLSGYGDYAKLDPEAAKVILRDRKGEMQQLAKIEDLTNRKPLEKSGVERRKEGDAERRLKATVNELKRRYGVVVTDASRQLKGAVDAIKTRLRNEIKDIAFQLETGEKPAAKTKAEWDEEAQKLGAVRDRLKKTLQDIEGKAETTDEQRLKTAMKSTADSIADYERRIRDKDLSGERASSKTPASAVLDAMKAKRDALKAEFEELRATDAAYQEEKAFDSLMKQGDEVEGKLKRGEVGPKGVTPKPADTVLVAEARARLGNLREQMKLARAATPEAKAAKVDAALEAVDRSIQSYTKRLETGDIDPATKKKVTSSPELDEFRRQRDELRKIVNDLRNYAKPKLTREEIGIKSLKSRLLRENADLLDRMAKKDFAPRAVRKLDLSKDPEAVRLKAENTRIKAEFEKDKLLWERENRKGLEKLWAVAAETLNLPRAVMSSFDASAVLRQGGMITLGDPKIAAGALKSMAEVAFSEKKFGELQAKIQLHPLYGEAKASGLFLAEMGEVRLTAKEEAIMSELADRIPGVRASNRAYVGYLNKLRFDSFIALHDTLTGGGFLRRKGKATGPELKAISEFINVATGRGNLGSHAKAAQTLATLFFSPRLMVSRFQLLAGPLTGFRFGGGSLRTRVLIAKQYGKTLIGLSVVMGLSAMGGATIEKDPRSSDFLKLKFGHTRVDLLFGLVQSTVLLARMGGKIKRSDGRFEKKDIGSTLGNFFRSKLAPVIGAAWDAGDILTKGKAPIGHPQTLPELALRTVLPLSFGDIYKAVKENGVPAGTALSIVSFLGAGVNVQDDRPRRR